jgi:hypothetical protein
MGGRDQSERLVAINRNRWSQSAGAPTASAVAEIRTTRSILRYHDNCGDKEYCNQRKSAIQGFRAGFWAGRTERGHETKSLYSFTSGPAFFGKDQPRTIHSENDANQPIS